MTWKFDTLRFTRKQLIIALAAAGLLATAAILVFWITANDPNDTCKNGTGDAAVKACTSLIQSEKLAGADLAEAFTNRGLVYGAMRQHVRAIQDFDRAIALKPDYAKAFAMRGVAYIYMKQNTRAIQDFDKAIALKPDYAAAYMYRSTARVFVGDLSGSLVDFETAKELDSSLGK